MPILIFSTASDDEGQEDSGEGLNLFDLLNILYCHNCTISASLLLLHFHNCTISAALLLLHC